MTAQRIVSQVSDATIGGYPIVEKIGAGGMGTVYKAKHPSKGNFVAVKVLTGAAAGHEVLRLRFAQECQLARNLDHPHIVRVLDFGMDGTRPFLVMEFVDGESLGQRLQRGGPLPEGEAVRIIRQVGEALHWAHQRKLIHRDVKPDNILLDASGQAKLTDLGLVKNLEGDCNLTETQSSLGTPNFMSPEQFDNAKRADARSDLYSLAATLYMAVTGVLPFSGRSVKAIVTIYKKKLANDLPPPRQIVPGLSEQLEVAILRGLDANRAKRHASVREFIDALPGGTIAVAPPAPPPPASAHRGAPRKAVAAAPPPPPVLRAAQRKERTKRRYTSKIGTTCKPLQRVPEASWTGRIINISEDGLCLELGRRYEPGALLNIAFDGEEGARRCAVGRVMWVKRAGPKNWTMGCQFDQPLCEHEVKGLC
jgi:serine/threonine protein kinase